MYTIPLPISLWKPGELLLVLNGPVCDVEAGGCLCVWREGPAVWCRGSEGVDLSGLGIS